jgi:hypothetical protein
VCTQASGQWERALQVAKTHDRVHLRTTHFLFAQHLESQGDIRGAMFHYEEVGRLVGRWVDWGGLLQDAGGSVLLAGRMLVMSLTQWLRYNATSVVAGVLKRRGTSA